MNTHVQVILQTNLNSRSFRLQFREALPLRRFSTVSTSLPPLRRVTDALTLSRLSHLRNPAAYYPAARRLARKVILHVGPTNSGKTFHALEALRSSSSGIYCGPLRLLAYEVFEKLNASGCTTDLITGQEVERREGARHVSSTIEMCEVDGGGLGVEEGTNSFFEGSSAGKIVDVAVIDEIQLLGDQNRGWAWTRVILGALAREIHLCGDESAVPLVTQILTGLGDSLEIRKYNRLSPLKVANESIRTFEDLRIGDCVVAFGRKKLFDIKQSIEKMTKYNVGVLYGALPPAVRRDQARRFNETSLVKTQTGASRSTQRTDILVATDAVGMGLNLSINRIVFSEVAKYDGKQRRRLTISEIKQIGGRAGRGKNGQGGIVTSLDPRGLQVIKESLNGQATPIVSKAGLMPSLEQFELFAAALAPRALIEELVDKETKKRVLEKEKSLFVLEEDKPSEMSHDVFDDDVDGAVCSENNIATEATSYCNFPLSSSSSLSVRDADQPISKLLAFSNQSQSVSLHKAISRRFLHTEALSHYHVHPSKIADWVVSSQYVSFSYVLRQFSKHSSIDDKRFFITDLTDMIRVAQLLDDIRPVLPFRVLLTFVQAPVDTDNALVVSAFKRYAMKLSTIGKVGVSLRLPTAPPRTTDDLESLESAHAVYELYIWLSRKFSAEFIGIEEARRGAARTQELILDGLERLGKDAKRKVNRRSKS